jgi:hypothetical protein
MALREKNAMRPASVPEKKYIDGMKLHDPHKKRNTLIIAGAFITAFVAMRAMKKR